MKWLSIIFGAPNIIFSENGGEFIGDSFINICEKFNIYVKTTQSFSPRSNTNTLLKVSDDAVCDYDITISWALCTKNSLINHNRFSPSQLVFGQNTNIPNKIDYVTTTGDKPTTTYFVNEHSGHVASLAKWLSFRLRTKWLWVWILLESPKLQILCLFWVQSPLTFR